MDSITELLGLGEYAVEGVREEGWRQVIVARYGERVERCGHCGSGRLHSHGWRRRRVSHVPVGRQWCEVEYVFQRWRCAACGRVQTPELPGVAVRARLSGRLRELAGQMLRHLGVVVSRLGRWLGLAWNTVWRCRPLAPEPSLAGVRHLCLDEVYFREPRRYLTVLSDAQRGVALGLVEGRGYEPSSALLQQLPAEVRAQVETLATDLMWGQRKAALDHLPYAEVAADCFHVVRLARQAVRQSTPAQRPAARQAVQELRALLRRNEPAALRAWMVRWKKADGPLRSLVATLSRWELELETYLTTRRSTGPAEALNRKISLLRRQACGYTNLSNFIAMILLTTSPSHHQR